MNLNQRSATPENAVSCLLRGAGATVVRCYRRCSCWLRFTLFDLKRLRSVALASAALAAVTYCILLAVAPPEPVPEPFAFDRSASWISTDATQQATGCFRCDLSIPGKVVNAWITLATNGGFEVVANGKSCARLFLLLPTRRFQEGLIEPGQMLTTADSAIGVNFPREYQWSKHDNAELPTWVDLTSFLHPGHNALCVEVETNHTPAALILSGEVLLDTGERIPIRSGTEWAAEPVPLRFPQESWTRAELPVSDWSHARVLPWQRQFWRLVPKGIYERPFRGKRIRSVAAGTITWLEQDLDLPKKPLTAFLRVATDTPYQIWINEHRIQPITNAASVLGCGSWFIREMVRSPQEVALEFRPEELDPDQVANLLPGQQSDTPPDNNSAGNSFSPDRGSAGGMVHQLTATGHPAESSGTERSNKAGDSSSNANFGNPDRLVPPALTRDRRKVEFLAYSITPLLREGRNTIRIGFLQRDFLVTFFRIDHGFLFPRCSFSFASEFC